MKDEEWRPVVGFEGLYEVSDLGRVRSLRSGKFRALAKNKGYPWVLLCRSRTDRRRAFVHVLVLEAFVGPRPPSYETGHKNHVRDDARLENLAWITKQENNDQMTLAGRRRYITPAVERVHGEDHPHAKLTTDIILQARALRVLGLTFRAIIAKMGLEIHPTTIRSAIRGITWKVVAP